MRDGEILLISAQPDRWQLPKGHLESGESAAQAAVREVEEETGVRGDVIAVLPTVEYRYRAGGRWIDKRVEYYLLRFVAGNEQGFDRSEVRAARWFTWAEALAEMSFENEREVVRQALEWTRGVREPPR